MATCSLSTDETTFQARFLMQTSLVHDYKMGVIVDVETTGMSPRNGDEVVEIGIILFRYNTINHDGVEIVETYQPSANQQIPFHRA